MSTSLGDYAYAARLRDTIRRISRREISDLRPEPRYATVISINRTTRRCEVKYDPSDTETVPVRMGVIQPSTTGQTVKVEGLANDRFITDVMGVAHVDGSVANAEALDGLDSTDLLRKGAATGGGENTRVMSNGTLNAKLRSGWYDGSGMTGAPTGDWWLVQVISHSNNADWQRQIAYSMTGEQSTQSIFSRRCNGADASIAGNWSRWEPVGPQPHFTTGYMARSSNYDGPDNSRYRLPMTEGTADDGRRPLYWDGGGILRCRWKGWYEFSFLNHTHSTMQGTHATECRLLPAVGGERVIGYFYHNPMGGTVNGNTGPVSLEANDAIDMVVQSPDGVAYVHNVGPFIRGRYLGPA